MKLKKISNNAFWFILGAVIFGSLGVVLATSISSSTVGYITNENNNVLTVEDALDDLYSEIVGHPITCYNGNCGKLSYRYWNDNFSNSASYTTSELPSTTYATRELLAQNYSSFDTYPVYMRSVLIDGNIVDHQVCLWYSNKEFCIQPDYWHGYYRIASTDAASKTVEKFQKDIVANLGVSVLDSCSYTTDYATCSIGSYSFFAFYSGRVDIRYSQHNCLVNFGNAFCNIG